MEIKQTMKDVHDVNVKNGFWENKDEKNIGELLMLTVSELAEALEADRHGKHANLEQYDKDVKNSNGSMYVVKQDPFKKNIKDTFEDELADTVIRVFDMAQGLGIDLERHIQLKLEYNSNRPYKHGKAY
jgi:NTP pyrophosphatase (non-canonical NTP hydrolase)